jgi:hypothetical protein
MRGDSNEKIMILPHEKRKARLSELMKWLRIVKSTGRREHNNIPFKHEINSSSCLFYFDISCESFIKKHFLLGPNWAVH